MTLKPFPDRDQEQSVDVEPEPGDYPRWSMLGLATLLYGAVAAVATYPIAFRLGAGLPYSGEDGLQHLWVMRWYRSCLLEGRLPWFCPEIQYPVGAPLALFSPLQLESLLYILIAPFATNDAAAYNLVWLSGIVFTGVGTFVLGWFLLRHYPSAILAGAFAMLSGPVRVHANGHLELIHLGWFPIFLVAWCRFADRPCWRRLIEASGAYLLLAMSAAYFLVFAIIPAVLYVAYRWWGPLRRREYETVFNGGRWLLRYALLVLPPLCLVFSSQLWALANGLELDRSRGEFDEYRAPIWSYAVPLPGYFAAKFLPFNAYKQSGLGPIAGEVFSYLGIVVLLLIHRAWFRDAHFRHRTFFWALLGVLVVLSMGSSILIGPWEIPMPAAWLWDLFPPLHWTRVPSRFNLFAAVVAAVIAGAGVKLTLKDRPRKAVRIGLAAAIGGLALADLALVPIAMQAIPEVPDVYRRILDQRPGAALLDAPQFDSGGHRLAATGAYWQSLHGGATSAGYAGHMNASYDNLISWTSPFKAQWLADPSRLDEPEAVAIELVRETSFEGYTWLYLTVHGFDYVILHRDDAFFEGLRIRYDRLCEVLCHAIVIEDPSAIVIDRDRLRLPERPVALCVEGWGDRIWNGRYSCKVSSEAEVAVYSPDPETPLKFAFEGAAFRRSRRVRLRDGGTILGRWDVDPGSPGIFVSPPFRLPIGLRTLVLESDGEDRPDHPRDHPGPPLSLLVNAVSFQADREAPPGAIAQADPANR